METTEYKPTVVSVVTMIPTETPDRNGRVFSKDAVLRALSRMEAGMPIVCTQEDAMCGRVNKVIGVTTCKPYAVHDVDRGVEFTVDGKLFFGGVSFRQDEAGQSVEVVSVSLGN